MIFPVPVLTQLNSSLVLPPFQLPSRKSVVFGKQFIVKNHIRFQSGLSAVPSIENAWISNFFRLHKICIQKRTTHNTNKLLLPDEWTPDLTKLYSSAEKTTRLVPSEECEVTPLFMTYVMRFVNLLKNRQIFYILLFLNFCKHTFHISHTRVSQKVKGVLLAKM